MLVHCIYVIAAYVVDRLVGDPRFLPHPVVCIGKCISLLERLIRSCKLAEHWLKLAGMLFPILIAGGAFFVVFALLQLLSSWNVWLGRIVEIWLISTTIAVKGLGDAGMEVYRALKSGNLEKARCQLGMIVGRDTEQLDESEISRGAVETVAENIVDAIISPLFYAILGGAPLAMAYRAVNTLDSMVGYKNKVYQNLGWASARTDDILNYIPARLTGLCILIVSLILRLQVKQAWLAVKQDARLHPSPNSGIPEAAVAGALGIQLGGTNFYKGIPSHRAQMGKPVRRINKEDIITTIQIMHVTAYIWIFILLFVYIGSVLI